MAALHAIRWTHVAAHPDRETLVLPLTRHDPRAPLWVHTYRALLFDHAKHAWCADPSRLSAPARACFEPLWQDLAAREMASMRSEEHTSELQSLMRISYAVFCLQKKSTHNTTSPHQLQYVLSQS